MAYREPTLDGVWCGRRNLPGHLDDNVVRALDRAVRGFRRARVPYVVIGGWALAVWGTPRATVDLDFLLAVGEGDLERLGAELSRDGLEVDEAWSEWNPMLRGSHLRLRSYGVGLDLLVPRDTHDRYVFRTRRKKRLDGSFYWFVAPDDLILQKLKVGRPQDFQDVMTVLDRSGSSVNRTYLRRWAGRLGISGELDYVLTQHDYPRRR
jgi:hypothetical protein